MHVESKVRDPESFMTLLKQLGSVTVYFNEATNSHGFVAIGRHPHHGLVRVFFPQTHKKECAALARDIAATETQDPHSLQMIQTPIVKGVAYIVEAGDS